MVAYFYRSVPTFRSDVCECREKLFWGFRKCAEKYDGKLVDSDDLKSFRKGAKSLKLNNLEKVGNMNRPNQEILAADWLIANHVT